MTNNPILLKGRLNGAQRTRLRRLLDMHYKPSELANVIGFSRRQIYRVYLRLGLLYERDQTGHLWINGKYFAKWYSQTFQKTSLGKNEAFCLTCKKAARFIKSTTKRKGELSYLICRCPNCGRKLAKIIKNSRGSVAKSK